MRRSDDESLRRKMLAKKSALSDLLLQTDLIRRSMSEDRIDAISQSRMRQFQQDVNSIKAKEELYGQVIEREFEQLQESYNRRN